MLCDFRINHRYPALSDPQSPPIFRLRTLSAQGALVVQILFFRCVCFRLQRAGISFAVLKKSTVVIW